MTLQITLGRDNALRRAKGSALRCHHRGGFGGRQAQPRLGALILALPLLSILAFIWLWRDTADTERIAALAQSTFWFVLPTLPMFLVLPVLLRSGTGFWPALGLSCLLTVVLYAAMVWALGRLGISL